MEGDDKTKQTGKWMFIAMWVVLLLLLVGGFGNLLDQQVNPNQFPQSQVSSRGASVVLERNRFGQYLVNGWVNGQPVTFLVDTGATDVSIPASLQRRLNLIPGNAFPAQTANGVVYVRETLIDELRVGDIRMDRVTANLNPGMPGDKILLGMSALERLEFSQRGNQLTLTAVN